MSILYQERESFLKVKKFLEQNQYSFEVKTTESGYMVIIKD